MSTEHETSYETVAPADEPRYSSFWPQLIIIVSIVLWSGYQIIVTSSQISTIDTQISGAQQLVAASKNAQARLYSLAQDVNQTAQKDQYAAQIVKEFNIQLTQAPNGAAPAAH